MKKRKKRAELHTIPPRNPVAKFAHRFNTAKTHRDKTKYYRKAKHKNPEPFPMGLLNLIGKGFGFRTRPDLVGQGRIESYILFQ